MVRQSALLAELLATMLLPAPAFAAETLVPLVNPGFEGAHVTLPAGGTVSGETASGWEHNSGYGDTTTVYARETVNPHSGSACQAITVKAVRDGNLQLIQGLALKAGTVVTLTAWLRGTRIDAAGSWRMALDLPGGKKALVLWNPKGAARCTLPSAYRGGTLTDLDGKLKPLSGAALDLTAAPVLVTAP
jgi:hypothetical protein